MQHGFCAAQPAVAWFAEMAAAVQATPPAQPQASLEHQQSEQTSCLEAVVSITAPECVTSAEIVAAVLLCCSSAIVQCIKQLHSATQ
jgi:hypothetical protein